MTSETLNALFIPCSVDGLSPLSGSVTWRARWPVKYWRAGIPDFGYRPGEAAVYDGTQRLTDYNIFIFQKAYRSARAVKMIHELAALRDRQSDRTTVLVLDMCDPDWLDESTRDRLLEILPLFDMAMSPTGKLTDWLKSYLPSFLVFDGIDLEVVRYQHKFNREGPPSVCWIGYPGNFRALEWLQEDLQHAQVDVEVIEIECPVSFDVFLKTLSRYDILLNPRPPYAPFNYKSGNKSDAAWASGVAVAERRGDLARLIDPVRRAYIIARRKYGIEAHNAELAAADRFRAIVSEILNREKRCSYAVDGGADVITVFVTLNWNTTSYFDKMLASVEETVKTPHRWVIVDNGSRRREWAMMNDTLLRTFPGEYQAFSEDRSRWGNGVGLQAAAIRAQANLGCVLGHNMALDFASLMTDGEPFEVVLINTDVEVFQPGWFEEIREWVGDRPIGIVGMEHARGEVCAGAVSLDPSGNWYLHPGQTHRDRPLCSESVGMGFTWIRWPVLQAGLRFDTGFELYYKQDDDLCFQVRADLGLQVWAYPVDCVHWGSVSLKVNDYKVAGHDGWDAFHEVKGKNQAYFAEKWAWALRSRRKSLLEEKVHLDEMEVLMRDRRSSRA